MEYIYGSRGELGIIYEGFVYYAHYGSLDMGIAEWKCIQNRWGCKSSLLSNLHLEHPKVIAGHNHKPNEGEVHHARLMSKQFMNIIAPYKPLSTRQASSHSHTVRHETPIPEIPLFQCCL